MVNDLKLGFNLGYRLHRGSFEESMKTKTLIQKDRFNELLPHYDFYGFDSRVSEFVFILKDFMSDRKKYPTFLFIEVHHVNIFSASK